MNMELFENALSQIKAFPDTPNIYCNMFGEPLLDKTCKEKFALLQQYGLSNKVYLQTNAELLTADIAEAIIKAGIKQIVPCMDSMDPSRAEIIRPGISWQNVKNNIIEFSRLRDAMHGETIIAVQHVRTALNLDDYHAMHDFCKQHLNPEKDKLNVIRSHTWASPYLASTDYILMKPTHIQTSYHCNLIETYLTVLVDGKITPCCFDYNLEIGDFGDANSESLLSIWNNSAFKELRMKISRGKDALPEICKHCISIFCPQESKEDESINDVKHYSCNNNFTVLLK